jgi:putative nucleotidyltransferase with HDIG domain
MSYDAFIDGRRQAARIVSPPPSRPEPSPLSYSPNPSGNFIVLLTGRRSPDQALLEILAAAYPVHVVGSLLELFPLPPGIVCIVADVDLSRPGRADLEGLDQLSSGIRPPLVVVVDQHAPEVAKQLRHGKGLGPTNYIVRPLQPESILRMLEMTTELYAGQPIGRAGSPAEIGVAAAHDVLSHLVGRTRAGDAIQFSDVTAGEGLILDALQVSGIASWMQIVQRHHDSTYRHSLLVTGAAVAFAQGLGMRRGDQRRLARAGLLHDIGKAFTPLSILDKPGRLTDAEMAEVRRHPVAGHQCLVAQGGFPDEILDCVRHHHEMLDGSGYPDGLQGACIGDLVRIITIADIFSALIEVRSYKPPLSVERALAIMREMGDKLDTDLLRVFGEVVADA